MKKGIVLFSALAFFAFSSSFAQEATKKKTKAKTAIKAPKVAAVVEAPKVEGASMKFVEETIDYGTVAHNADGKREFVFTNNGNKPLIITNAQGSCGCTVATFPKEPILPGAKAVIPVKYATDRVGPFTKTVTLTSNAVEASKVLTIKGTVLPDATPVAEPKKM